MADNDLKELMDTAVAAAVQAGGDIMDVYGSDDMKIRNKEDDSPVTRADLKADAMITGMLRKTGLPVLSEEGGLIPYPERKSWGLFWLVDPLDGTKEFIDRSGEFTVNIALVNRDTPVGGVVYAPVQRLLYGGLMGSGAWKAAGVEPGDLLWQQIMGPWHTDNHPGKGEQGWLKLPCIETDSYGIVGSRSFMDDCTRSFIDGFCSRYPGSRMVTWGSSLKFCMLAEGKADIYPRFTHISEWDTAAGHAVLSASGGYVVQVEGGELSPLLYNKPFIRSPWFIAYRDNLLLMEVKDLIRDSEL